MTCRLKVHRWGGGARVVFAGQAEPARVLCLHSSGLSGFQWRRLAEKAGDYPLCFLAPDFLGCGQSPSSSRGLDFSYREDLAEILALLDSLADRVILLGHSYGGFIALKSALERQEQVVALGLYEPVLWGGLASYRGVSIQEVVARFDPQGILLNRDLAATEIWLESFIDYWNGRGSWQTMSESARRPMWATAEKLFAEVREVVVDSTPHTDYSALAQPTLILHGTTSPPEVLEMKDILTTVLANVRTASIPGGHMNPVRNPLPVNAHFEVFLKGLAPAQRKRSP